ncbi:hypothetical protein [Paenibacillus sp. MBLB4367]
MNHGKADHQEYGSKAAVLEDNILNNLGDAEPEENQKELSALSGR